MLTIDPEQLIEVAVERQGDGFGDGQYAPAGTVAAWRRLAQPQLVSQAGKQVYVQTGAMYVERDSDEAITDGIRDGDRVTLPEGTFRVVGPKQLDQDHPMNSHDFGWVRISLTRTW